jgi:hypothetical protein
MTREAWLRDDIVRFARSLFECGYAVGPTGDISLS